MTFQVESGESWSRSFHRKHPPTCMQSSWKVGGHLQVQSLAAPELFGHGKGGGTFLVAILPLSLLPTQNT